MHQIAETYLPFYYRSSSDYILLVLMTFLRFIPVYIESTVFSARS